MAQFVQPFFWTKYKTDVTIYCLLKALGTSVVILDNEHQHELEEIELESSVGTPHTDRWQAPEIKWKFKIDAFFSLCKLIRVL